MPPGFIFAGVHLIRKGNLLVIPRGEKAHLRPIGLDSTLEMM